MRLLLHNIKKIKGILVTSTSGCLKAMS